VVQARWLTAHTSQFRLRTIEDRVIGEGGEFGVDAAARESCLAHPDEFRRHAALGSERLTEGSDKLVVVLPPLLGHWVSSLLVSWFDR